MCCLNATVILGSLGSTAKWPATMSEPQSQPPQQQEPAKQLLPRQDDEDEEENQQQRQEQRQEQQHKQQQQEQDRSKADEWERRVQLVRKYYEEKGYRVHSGFQFGCELVLYADEPGKVHSDFCVHVVPEGTYIRRSNELSCRERKKEEIRKSKMKCCFLL